MALTPHISNAFRDVQRAMLDLEHMFGGLPGTLMPTVFTRATSRHPTTDVIETKDSYELHAEVPGFDKKDIQVEVPDSHTIVLKGTMQQERKEVESPPDSSDKQEGAEGTSDTQQVTTTANDKEKQVVQGSDDDRQWWVQERVSGSFLRSFHLPINIDPQSIKASCVDGVLKVTIPKAESKKSASIDID